MRSSHLRVLFLVFVPAVLIFLVVAYLAARAYSDVLTVEQYWSIFCFCFLVSWWLVYFSSRKLRLWSLRVFLDSMSVFRPEESKAGMPEDHEEKIVTKAAFTIGSQGIFIAIVALFLTLVIQTQGDSVYDQLLQYWIVGIALIAILLMVFAIDILDTVSNVFSDGEKNRPEYRVWFYRHVGPFVPKGGISYAYLGYAFFSVFLVMSLATFHPLLASVGVAAYTYLGYPFLFGYKGRRRGGVIEKVDVDKKSSWVAALLGCFFLAAAAASRLVPQGLPPEVLQLLAKLP